jgi:hypothetical protein
MLFLNAPYLLEITGDDYRGALNGLSGGVPVFGSIAFTHAVDFKGVKTCFNGVEYDDAMALLMFWGNINPRFFLSTIPEERFLNHEAIITDSYKNRIRRINGIPALEYLESVGLVAGGKITGIASFPLILHNNDGSRVIRTIYGEENGELLCSGAVPDHTSLEICFCDKEFVVESARQTAKDCARWLESGESGADQGTESALVISCAARRWTLGTDIYSEIREIDAGLAELPYHFAYSSGEFCPVTNKNGELVNYFFNYSLCICIL